MSGSVRPPRVQPAPPPPDASVPGHKHKPDKQTEKQDNSFLDLNQVASATECTGILAAQVQNEDEAESISALEGIHTIRPPRKTKKH